MKKFISPVFVFVLTVIFTISVFAQDNQKKNELFGKIAKLTQTKKPEDRDKAYVMSKDFLTQYGSNAEDEQVKKLKDFVEKYRVGAFTQKLDEVKVAEAFALGKEILAQEPENTLVIINMAYGGYVALDKKKDKSYAADSIKYAKQALSLMEAGKVPISFEPFKTQAEVTGVMHFVIGTFAIDDDPASAANSFYKALQYESPIKNTSYPYYAIAYGYEKTYEKLAKDYEAKVAAKAKEADLIAAQDRLMLLVDRMLDAYARALKMAETDNNPSKDAWKQRFTEVYKFSKQSDAGLNEYIASVMTKPLPDPSAF